MFSALVIMLCGANLIGIECRLLEKPSHQIVIAEQSVMFKCTSDVVDHPIIWYWSQARQPSVKEVFNGVNGKDPRFRFKHETNANMSRTSWLIMDSVMVEDGGSVACQEDEGFGERSLAKLSVIKADPNCTFNTTDQQLTTSCTYQYWGESTLEPDWWLSIEHLKIYEEGRTDEDHREGNICEHRSTLKVNTTSTYCRQLKMMMVVDGRSFHIKEANSSYECRSSTNDSTQVDWLRFYPDVIPTVESVKQGVALAISFAFNIVFLVIVLVIFTKKFITRMNKKESESLQQKSPKRVLLSTRFINC